MFDPLYLLDKFCFEFEKASSFHLKEQPSENMCHQTDRRENPPPKTKDFVQKCVIDLLWIF